MNTYENLVIFKGNLTRESIENELKNIEKIITEYKGKLLNLYHWGVKNLAYEIRKEKEGYFVKLYFQGTPDLVSELDRKYGINENFLRIVIIKLAKKQIKELVKNKEITLVQ